MGLTLELLEKTMKELNVEKENMDAIKLDVLKSFIRSYDPKFHIDRYHQLPYLISVYDKLYDINPELGFLREYCKLFNITSLLSEERPIAILWEHPLN